MENVSLVEAVLGATFVEFVVRLLWGGFGGLLTMFGFWGMRRRIAAVEKKMSGASGSPPVVVNQTIGVTGPEIDRMVRESMQLREVLGKLNTTPLGDSGHRYAELPQGTNIVKLADGQIKLALPVRLSAQFIGAVGGISRVSLDVKKPDDDQS